jgi:hypothetical protein
MDYLEGSTVVVVMGGHGVRRASQEYRQVSFLAYTMYTRVITSNV